MTIRPWGVVGTWHTDGHGLGPVERTGPGPAPRWHAVLLGAAFALVAALCGAALVAVVLA